MVNNKNHREDYTNYMGAQKGLQEHINKIHVADTAFAKYVRLFGNDPKYNIFLGYGIEEIIG